jgi:D-isomer specific 2-hydroxyacid dehydrogenase, NAD binding domain
MTTARTIRVWLPEPGWVEAMGGLPGGMTADVWTGGEQLPDSAREVEVVVLPFGVPGSRLPMLAELTAGRLRAALDVTDPEPLPPGHPLWSAPGLLLTPHVAGLSTQTIPRAQAIVRDQLARYTAGEPLRNVVGARGY